MFELELQNQRTKDKVLTETFFEFFSTTTQGKGVENTLVMVVVSYSINRIEIRTSAVITRLINVQSKFIDQLKPVSHDVCLAYTIKKAILIK